MALFLPLLICAGVGKRVCLCEHVAGIEQATETSRASCCSTTDSLSPLSDGPGICEPRDECCCQAEGHSRLPISSEEARPGGSLSDRSQENFGAPAVALPSGFAALEWLLSAPWALKDSVPRWPDRVRLYARFESYLC